MPWQLQKSGNGYFVVDDKGKRYSDKPMSKWQAKKQLAALWASEKAALTKGGLPASSFLVIEDPGAVSTWHLPVKDASGKPNHGQMGGAWAALHGGYRGSKYEGPGKQEALRKLKALYESEGMVTPSEKGYAAPSLAIFKQSDGQYRWVTLSSSAFKDRDGEIVTEKALADDVDRCDASGIYGPLRWFHIGDWEAPDGLDRWDTWKASGGVDLGTCDFNMLHGRILIESGTFKDPIVGEAFAAAQNNLEVSIGFSHPRGEPGTEKMYRNIHRFERSLLPAGMASNLLTKIYTVKGDTGMKTTEKLSALVAILKGKPDVAQRILADAEAVQRAAEAAGLEFKEVEELISSGEGPSEEEPVTGEAEGAPKTDPDVVDEAILAGATTEGEPEGEHKATVTVPAVAAPKPEPEMPDEIGDMTHKDLATFITEVVKQLLAKKEVEAETKAVESAQALADAYVSLKAQAERVEALEKEVAAQKQMLADVTDVRPVGIKQMQARRATERDDNVTAKVPSGPRMDDSFVKFMQGGK